MGQPMFPLVLLGVICLTSVPMHAATRIAIVGAGIGGSFTSYFIRKQLGYSGVSIEVYERDGRVGGRAKEEEIDGQVVEMGASMAYENNYYVRDTARELGLELKQERGGVGKVHIFDGKKIVMSLGDGGWMDYLRVLWRWGLSPLRFSALPKQMFGLFQRVYDLQSAGRGFATVPELLTAMGPKVEALTHTSFQDYYSGWYGAGRFGEELVAGANRVNYQQGNGQLNALVGLVSNLPAVDPRVFSIRDGNGLLPQRLLNRTLSSGSGALHLQVRVQSVTRHSNGTFSLAGEGGAGSRFLHGPYDAVVLAAPLEASSLQLQGPELPPRLPARQYQTCITTYIEGELRPSFFGQQAEPSGQIIVTDSAPTAFSSLSPKGRAGAAGAQLFKVFTNTSMEQADWEAMFSSFKVLKTKAWKAYPKFKPPEEFAPFALAPGLYYNNAIESAASAMEMSAIAARNSANLLVHHLRQRESCEASEPQCLEHS